MKNIIDYIKDKIYYILGGTVVIIILLVLISSCSSGGRTYESIEQSMVNAAKEYYSSRKNKLPKEEETTIKVTTGTLVEAELLNEITDPKNKEQTCSGYVEVTKVGDEYSYMPFLTCKGNYEPKYLTDIVKSVKTDEYGNGVYTINNELVYRGDDVNNYVSFNDQLWRIVKVDSEGDIKLVLAKKTEDTYNWDDAYNSEKNDYVGITTDYLHTNIRKALNDYYENNFTKESKAKMVSKNLCVGKYLITDNFSIEKECSIIKENEKVGLLNATDYQNASLDSGCTNLQSNECTNYNYLSSDDFTTWLLNSSSENTYTVLNLRNGIDESRASREMKINPVINITAKTVILTGNGTKEEPYEVK